MRALPLLAAALLTTTLAPAASAATESADLCVEYAYVADYHWYWVCVDPKGGACAVYFREQHGVTVTERCLKDEVVIVPPAPRCVQYAQDLDYSHHLCVDATDASCAVYLWRTSGGHETRTCVPGSVSTAQPESTCIPTSGGLDYPSYLCVDPSNVKCVAYHETTSDWGTRRFCVPGLP